MNRIEAGLWQAWRGPLILIVSVFILWQGLYLLAGEMAMRSPLQTFSMRSEELGLE